MKKLLILSLLSLLAACDPAVQSNPSPQTPVSPVNNNTQLPPLNIGNGDPGNLKAWITAKAQKEHLQIDWKLKGTYNLSEEEKKLYEQSSIGTVLSVLPGSLTTNNFMLFNQWQARYPDKPFPYPLGVFIAQCQNTLIFVEMLGQDLFDNELKNGALKGCTIPKPELGLQLTAPPMTASSTLL